MLNENGLGARAPFRERIAIMKKTPSERGRRGLHLVTSAAKNPNDKFDYQIAQGVLQLRTLEDEFADEALSEIPDPDHVARLTKQMEVVRNWLTAHGVRVRG
jgi:hypothetical protein